MNVPQQFESNVTFQKLNKVYREIEYLHHHWRFVLFPQKSGAAILHRRLSHLRNANTGRSLTMFDKVFDGTESRYRGADKKKEVTKGQHPRRPGRRKIEFGSIDVG